MSRPHSSLTTTAKFVQFDPEPLEGEVRMATKQEQLQRIVTEYRMTWNPWPAEIRKIALSAMNTDGGNLRRWLRKGSVRGNSPLLCERSTTFTPRSSSESALCGSLNSRRFGERAL